MNTFRFNRLTVLLFLLLTICACNAPVQSEEKKTLQATLTEAIPISTDTPEPTPIPVIDTSLYIPEIDSTSTQTLYEQNQRARLGGKDTFFWPDGNIGFFSIGNGQFRFFAANSIRSEKSIFSAKSGSLILFIKRLC